MLLENTVGEPAENLLLGLESLNGDPGSFPFALKGVETKSIETNLKIL